MSEGNGNSLTPEKPPEFTAQQLLEEFGFDPGKTRLQTLSIVGNKLLRGEGATADLKRWYWLELILETHKCQQPTLKLEYLKLVARCLRLTTDKIVQTNTQVNVGKDMGVTIKEPHEPSDDRI